MDKKKLFQGFGDEEKIEVLNLYEKYKLALDKDITVFGNNFYSPNIWTFFKKQFETNEFKIVHDGFFKDSERQMISFNNMYNMEFPYKVIKIEIISKFNKVSHRDYLGAILALGIKRNKIGDLLVKDNCCYLPICEEIEEFLLCNLTTIGKVSCKVELLEEGSYIPEFEFTEEIILIQSLRIDSIVSKLARISRVKAQDVIEEGKVLVDYNKIKEKSYEVVEGSRVTIRGSGKFIVSNIVGNSKSGKIKVLIKKYN